MTKPLALVCYESLMPGSKLPNCLEDLGYRVQIVDHVGKLAAEAAQQKPMVILLDLSASGADVCEVIRALRQGEETAHIPILAFAAQRLRDLQTQAQAAGATMVASDGALLKQLPQLLERLLEIE